MYGLCIYIAYVSVYICNLYMCMCMCMCVYTYKYMYILRARARTHTHTHTHTPARAHTRKHTHTHACARTHTQKLKSEGDAFRDKLDAAPRFKKWQVISLLALPSTTGQMLTAEALQEEVFQTNKEAMTLFNTETFLSNLFRVVTTRRKELVLEGTQVTCFTSTTVQILTQKACA